MDQCSGSNWEMHTYLVLASNMQDLEDGPHINTTKPVTEHSHADTDMTYPTELILNQLVYC
jgi:hypothetical protein